MFVSVEDKDGESLSEVYEIKSLVSRFPAASQGCCLCFLSEDEDAMFNRYQIPAFLKELASLKQLSEQERAEQARLEASAKLASAKPNRYLKLYGDKIRD